VSAFFIPQSSTPLSLENLITSVLILRSLQRNILMFYIFKVPEGRHNNSNKHLYILKSQRDDITIAKNIHNISKSQRDDIFANKILRCLKPGSFIYSCVILIPFLYSMPNTSHMRFRCNLNTFHTYYKWFKVVDLFIKYC
jgi:hypothetical protein